MLNNILYYTLWVLIGFLFLAIFTGVYFHHQYDIQEYNLKQKLIKHNCIDIQSVEI